jgi:hypothetical protein
MKAKLLNLLAFLNLTDTKGNLSLTNSAVFIVLAKIAIEPTIDWTVVSGLLITLLNYGHKRYELNRHHEIPDDLSSSVKEAVEKANLALDQAGKIALSLGLKAVKKDE